MTSAATVPTAQLPQERTTRRSRGKSPLVIVGEAVLAVAITVLVSLALQWAIPRAHLPHPSNAEAEMLTLGATALLGGMALSWRLDGLVGGRWARLVTSALVAGLTTLLLALPLAATRLFYLGFSGDEIFRVEFLTRLTHSAVPTDMNFADLPSYYPVGWFWLGGRFANLFGLHAWAANKPYSILTVAVTSTLCYQLWASLVRHKHAMLIATATTLVVGVEAGPYEPYSWLIGALLPPFCVLAHRALAATTTRRGVLLTVGVFLGIAALTYTLYFWYALLTLTLTAGVAVVSADQPITALRPAVRRVGLVLAVALPIAAIQWAPYTLVAWRQGFPEGYAQTYLPPESARFPLPMLEVSPTGALFLLGTIWMVMRAKVDDRARALLIGTGAVYLWFAMSFLALLGGTTLLPFRLGYPLQALLTAAAVLGSLDLLRTALPKAARAHKQHSLLIVRLLTLAIAVSLAQSVPVRLATFVKPAYHDYLPTGHAPDRHHSWKDEGAWTPRLKAAIADLTHRPPEQLVLLSAHRNLMIVGGYLGYQQGYHYANPLAMHNARDAEITAWAHAANPDELQRRLNNGPFRTPDVFVLSRTGGLHIRLSEDDFPRAGNTDQTVVFPDRLFTGPHFARRDIGAFAVIARR